MKPVALRSTTSLVLAFALFSACTISPKASAPERPLEERGGLTPARGLVSLDDARAIPVRFRVADAVYAFFVFPGPRLAAWAKRVGAKLDVENGAIVRPGLPPVPLANARDLARRMSGPQNAWLFSTELDLWVPLGGIQERELIRDEDVAVLAPGLPWYAVRLELDEEETGIDIDVDVGGAYWRYVMREPDDHGPVRLTFDAPTNRFTRSSRLERVREATLASLSSLPVREVLLENLHGLSLEPGRLLSRREARALFDEVQRLEGVPWEVVSDGCGERAMIAAAYLTSRGVRPVKVFAVGDLRLDLEPVPIEWSFHVAPAVFVEHEGVIEVLIFDPAVERRPLLLTEWLGRFVKGPVVIDVVPWFQRNAIEWGGFEREADAADKVVRAREALEEVVAEWHQEKAARALEEAAAERAQISGGQRPALSY